jgi:hypothetical protein
MLFVFFVMVEGRKHEYVIEHTSAYCIFILGCSLSLKESSSPRSPIHIHNCSIPSTNLSNPSSSPSTSNPLIMRALSKVSLVLTKTEIKTYKFPTLATPILSSNSLDLTSAVSITLSGTLANLATLRP